MISLTEKYRPILSTPFGREGYREAAPCEALKPYIRCFWTQKQTDQIIWVIPDTCMDIIFRSEENGVFKCSFSTIDEKAFCSENKGAEFFGIRFYAWTAGLFLREELSGKFPVEELFSGAAELITVPQRSETFAERVSLSEKWLLGKLDSVQVNADFLNSVDFIIDHWGSAGISDISSHTAVSPRTLERLFKRQIGISPKRFSELVRYQLLWQEITAGKFNMLDAMEKYGYYAQAHLLNDFKKRHMMNPKQALEYAEKFR